MTVDSTSFNNNRMSVSVVSLNRNETKRERNTFKKLIIVDNGSSNNEIIKV